MQENNKRIAKNTLFLYFRMLLTMGVSLYTSRVVLSTLGVEDFGVYGVVGGIVAMFGFLNASMSGATSRFLTFELGRQNFEKLRKTFSAALTVHFIIAGIVFVLCETVGLWWLENKLVIMPDKMPVVRWVYQLSILSSMINITQVPYNATIIAHERMNVYAYVEILNSLLKLGIVYLLVIGNFDKLMLYAILTLCVSIIITTIYKKYCTKNFPESHYIFEWNKEVITPILSFSGWDMFGNLSQIAKGQGVNILLNLFFGVVVNTAYGIASQIQGAVTTFSNNFLTAVRPQIVKSYATGEIEKMQNLMIDASKFSFLLFFIISFPLIVENNFILRLWLKKVPDYAVVFSQLNLLSALLTSMFTILTFAIHATGKIKFFSFISGAIYIMVLPISYFLLKKGFSPIVPFVTNIILLFIGYMNNLNILHSLIPKFSVKKFISKSILTNILVIVLSSILPVWLHYSYEESWQRFVSVVITSTIMICLSGYFLSFSKRMREKVLSLPRIIKKRFWTKQQLSNYKGKIPEEFYAGAPLYGRFNLNLGFLQNIRFMLALIEKYEDVYVPVEFEKQMDYLNQFFEYHPKYAGKDVPALKHIYFSHNEPLVAVNGIKYPLLFPHQMINKCNQPTEKTIDFSFTGLKTEKRIKFLSKWLKNTMGEEVNLLENDYYYWNNSKIVFSNKGRNFPIKLWDKEYYNDLQRTKFVLCPNGDFVWTYRFFEAIMCRAIPIVEDSCNIYDGFKYYTQTDMCFEYNEMWIEYNLQLLIKKFSL